jgi:hypothetical protein
VSQAVVAGIRGAAGLLVGNLACINPNIVSISSKCLNDYQRKDNR